MINTRKLSMLLAGMLLWNASTFAQSKWVIRFNDDSEKEFDKENIREMFPITLDAVVIEEVRSSTVNYEW